MKKGPSRKFDWDEARRLRDQGWSLKAIAETFGVSIKAVHLATNDDALKRSRAYSAKRQRSGVCAACGGQCTIGTANRPGRRGTGERLCIACRSIEHSARMRARYAGGEPCS